MAQRVVLPITSTATPAQYRSTRCYRIFLKSGRTVRELAAVAQISKTQVGDLLTGRRGYLPRPATRQAMRVIAAYCDSTFRDMFGPDSLKPARREDW